MAEMLVASWLSCCKPHIPGRVNPTFKPKPRYRQPGQQQWHISNYPKTKCPSFVCNRHSGSFSAHGITSGRLEGFRTALCSHLTAQNCLKELRCLVVKRPWGMKFYINLYSSGNTPHFQPADLCTCSMYSTDFLLFFSFFFGHRQITWHQSRAQLNIISIITDHVPVNPCLTWNLVKMGK